MSTIVDMASAVVTELNAGEFSQEFVAVRAYLPRTDLAELAALTVTVAPKSMEITSATRDSDFFDVVLDVGVQKRINADTIGKIDEMVALVQEIVDYLRRRKLTTLTAAGFLSISNEPIVYPDHLDQHRVFTSVVSVTYRVRR